MGKIFLTSDLHFNHDREFIWGARGFDSVEEMNKAIIERFNAVVTDEDDVYILGDVMLGDSAIGESYLQQLKGKLHFVLGNHDTNTRIEIYKKYGEVLGYATMLKYRKCSFYLSHYPTLTANLSDEPSIHAVVVNLFGHTHQTHNFYEDRPYMYHVGVDSHNCAPVDLDNIIEEIKNKINECKEKL